MLAGGAIFVIYDLWVYGTQYLLRLFISTGFIFVFVYFLFKLGVFGGADAKSLIVLSFIIPSYPEIILIGYDFPINDPLPLFREFFAFVVFENAVILTIVVPLSLVLYNLLKMGPYVDKPLYSFIGYKTTISDISEKQHIKMIEGYNIKNNDIEFFFKRGGLEIDENVLNDLKNFSRKGVIKDVWVTPGLPFMIPITLGFFVAIFYGDIITELTKYIILN